eukprot:14076999-Ditylum_brightwellii.AAC.1
MADSGPIPQARDLRMPDDLDIKASDVSEFEHVQDRLLKEMRSRIIEVRNACPKVQYRVFEDNAGTLEEAKVHKMRLHANHINTMYHHFRSWVHSDHISLCVIKGKNQPSYC